MWLSKCLGKTAFESLEQYPKLPESQEKNVKIPIPKILMQQVQGGNKRARFLANSRQMIFTQTNFANPALEVLTDNFYKNYKPVASVVKTNFPLS